MISDSVVLYDSLSRQKRKLQPLTAGRVKIYSCGITVYDEPHIGHASGAYYLQMLIGVLTRLGLDVKAVRNYTDVDDKIIERSSALGVAPAALSESVIERTEEIFERCGLNHGIYHVRVRQHIDAIVEMIERLIERGAAYATADGHVYFRVAAFPRYGALSGQNVDQLRSGARELAAGGGGKLQQEDFVLWKPETLAGAAWSSPWGMGRPGWHIECSALIERHLGAQIDIHCGGRDLVFPHHENEIAQSQADQETESLAQIWLHHGLVKVGGQKMSKSLGNFLSLADFVRRWDPEILRLCCAQTHYRSDVELGEDVFFTALKRLLYFYEALGEDKPGGEPLRDQLREDPVWVAAEAALRDDLATPEVVSLLHGVCRQINQLSRQPARQGEVTRLRALARALGGVLGLLQQPPAAMIHGLRSKGLAVLGVSQDEVTAALAARELARAAKDWPRSDALREQMAGQGIALLDTPTGSGWTLA